MQTSLYEINWFLSGFAFGAVTVWMISLIVRLHFVNQTEVNHE